MNTIAKNIAGFFGLLVIVGVLGGAALYNLPDTVVYESYSSKECVKVEIKGKEFPCSVIEERGITKYDHVWTK